jgi:protein-S-isoprenylcysteine O-methyltransferase Ste14
MTTQAQAPAPAGVPGSDPAPTTDLLHQALGEVGEVVRLEVALARRELTTELAAGKAAAIALGTASASALMALTMLLVAIALALPIPWIGAVVIGAVLLALAAGLAAVGWRRLPKRPLEKTKNRVETDIAEAKERLI